MNRFAATITLVLLGLAVSPLSAEQFGLFTYEVLPDNTIEITDYPQDATGEVIIPSEIEGKTVSQIGGSAFYGCTGLTTVSIPDSVTTIGGSGFSSAFSGCSGLTSIVVAPGNPAYASADGVLFNAERTRLVAFPEGKPGNYIIPDGVATIGDSAFSGCIGLTSVTIPSSVTEIAFFAFAFTRLQLLVFSGDSPRFGQCAFYGASSPAICVANLVTVPRVTDGHLSIRYDPSYRGFSYRVETSRDLVHWTEEEVSWSEWGPDGLVTASVPMDGPTRFLRLVPYITHWDNCPIA